MWSLLLLMLGKSVLRELTMKTVGVLVLSFVCLSTSVHAAKQLTIMTIELPPYAYKEGDQVAGFATDIVRLALNRMNIKYKVMIQPWARSLLDMQSGSIDGLFPMFKTNERMVFTLYPEKPLVFQYTSLFTHQGFTIQFDGLRFVHLLSVNHLKKGI